MIPIRVFISSVQREFAEERLAYGLPKPIYRQDEDFRVVLFRPNLNDVESTNEGQGPSQGPSQGPRACIDASVLIYCRSPKKVAEMLAVLGYTNRTKFRRRYLEPLLDEALLEMTIPEKPTSSRQSYRLTAKGEAYLQRLPLDE